MTGLDLGLSGRTALVCGSSAGLGRACAEALTRAGATVVLNGRDPERLAAAAEELCNTTGVELSYICADVTSPAGRQTLLSQCANPDILVNNSAGPPAGDVRDFDEADWAAALHTTMIAPIMMIKGVIDGMTARGWGRIINITSSSVKAPLPLLALSNGGRSGLTGFVAGLARQVARHNVTINNLLPGPFLTDRLRSGIEYDAGRQNVSFEEMLAKRGQSNPTGRVGDPAEFGDACAFLCGANSGFIVGQNLLLDGGAFNSTMG